MRDVASAAATGATGWATSRAAAAIERRPDEVLDGRGVVVVEVVLGDQGAPRRRRHDGCRWKRQDLKPAAIECDEILVDEAVADEEILVGRELERIADPVVCVE